MLRTHNCGELRTSHENQVVKLAGWVQSCRNLGGLLFVALRDHDGLTQLVIDLAQQPEIAELAQDLRDEFVIKINGQVRPRPTEMVNQAMSTGEIEVVVTELEILNRSLPLPFNLAEDKVGLASENLRLQYRFLDLRRPSLQSMLTAKDQLIRQMRYYFQARNFVEIQTPILANSSPEGARDFLIPSRLFPGHCYALPQAPQQFKQLLMIGGLDRYFQIAPCFRDEDSRQDRHYGEFYQLDMEMSFIDSEEDIWQIMEPLMIQLTDEFSNKQIIGLVDGRFPRLTWRQAMTEYGSDKPDLRFALKIKPISYLLASSSLSIFQDVLKNNGVIHSLVVPKADKLSRKQLDELVELAKLKGLGGLGYLIYNGDNWQGSLAKNIEPDILQELISALSLEVGQTILIAAGQWLPVCQALGAIRNQIANWFNLADNNLAAWCWVIDFPFYEAGETATGLDFSHNPFSMPKGGLEA
ncbi:aspartate--tRNA ligase, partial [Candidatus Falkowbacteria bacterium]|nr:aspartate--tRNA ligase [Candidatus Falkowbacteria bacterium]